ncbi:MAG: recombinase family protein [Fibromonadaceae bacterium]|jgi:DNA invertase Pin-like site-specific DNA recombinase|nr:recombinase family protein [Fibromonadaceae bacterium]
MIYGYVRVSTAQQNVENGLFEIAKFAQKEGFSVGEWVTEQIFSTKDLKKRKLGSLLRKVKKDERNLICPFCDFIWVKYF